ncbi:hypothetical protein H5410_043864 [Solanum commersonii]|uniref:Uncharacterized protein n=1 Tax=Solanum commersonii TaxID=4109 RepID=A0A9J5Y2J5_SOLCO|nr:hypothetical protein H5410_043864 [Solanum commersonii]
MDSQLVEMCMESATESLDAVEAWRRQRRTLEMMPSQLAEALLHRLLRRRLLFPSLLDYGAAQVVINALQPEAYVAL